MSTTPWLVSPEPGAFDLVHSLRRGFKSFPIDQASGRQARITIATKTKCLRAH